MAEIKSTLDMVMERAARIGTASKEDLNHEEATKKGMRLAASYLRGEEVSLQRALQEESDANKRFVQQGIVQTMLRNIVLPRKTDQQELAEKAMHGLVEMVGQAGGELLQVFGELKKIVDQYLQHREQLRDQLKAQFTQQMEMMQQSLAQQTGVSMKLDPAQHPKFQEEWQRIQTELNDQYGRALEHYKKLVEQHLAS